MLRPCLSSKVKERGHLIAERVFQRGRHPCCPTACRQGEWHDLASATTRLRELCAAENDRLRCGVVSVQYVLLLSTGHWHYSLVALEVGRYPSQCGDSGRCATAPHHPDDREQPNQPERRLGHLPNSADILPARHAAIPQSEIAALPGPSD